MILPIGLRFVLPKSPRWLIAQGNHHEAKDEDEKAALENQVQISSDTFELQANGDDLKCPEYMLKDMFCKSQLKITLTLFICWPVIITLYFGLTLSADKIKITDNIFTSFILVTIVEVPGY